MRSIAPLLLSASLAILSASAQTSGPLRACQTFITSNGTRLGVYSASKVGTAGSVIQCNYAFVDALGSSTNATCSYDGSTFALIPTGTPSGIPSDPACTNPLPHAADAGTFLIQNNQGTVCLGAGSTGTPAGNGSPVFPGQCDGRHNYPLQSWTFDGLRIRQGNFCIDVTDGNTANGAKLQMWTCYDGNTNQQWNTADSTLLLMPANKITWKTHTNKCMDLTNGDTSNFLQTQIWDCFQGNTNQVWTIKPAN